MEKNCLKDGKIYKKILSQFRFYFLGPIYNAKTLENWHSKCIGLPTNGVGNFQFFVDKEFL